MLVAIFTCLLTYIATLTHAGGTDIPLDFYTDNACAAPSTTAANISLEVGVCAVTPGLGSFVLEPYPCSSGDVVQYAFSDTACGQPHSASLTSIEGYCYAELEGGDIAAIMLSCDQTSPGHPTSTTTIAVGPIATGGSNSSTSSTTGNGDGSSFSSDPDSPTSGWNSLSLPVRIVIIVGVSVGVLSAILGGSYKKRRSNAAKAYVVPVQQTDHTYTETFHMSYRALA